MRRFLPFRFLRSAARLLVAALLFAQAVAVAHACNVDVLSAPAHPKAGLHAADRAAMPCHDAKDANPRAEPACKAHCTAESQTNGGTSMANVPQIPAIPLLTVAPALPEHTTRHATQIAQPAPAVYPPPAILFSVFRS
jgi:hypothetical protein